MRNKTRLIIIPLIFFCTFLFGQTLDEIQILSAMDADDNEESGMSVAISGDFAAVGAWKEDHDAMGSDSLVNAGTVYMFERDSIGTWVEVQKLVASDRSVRDRFGKSVAIDGNYLVVGAHLKDIVSANPNAGIAYVFERDTLGVWNEVEILLASDRAEFDEFGSTVSIFGKTIVIGAPFEDQNTMNMDTKDGAGSAYIFKKNMLGDWVETQKIAALDRNIGDFFGTDVSIWDSTIIVGAYRADLAASQTDAGAVYFFQQDINGNFIETQKVTASDIEATDYFGFAVDIFDNKVVIGAYFEDEDLMNNNTLSEAGSAYVFEKGTDGYWHQAQKLVASDRDAGDFFGYDVAISGNLIIVGARLEDQDEMGNIFRDRAGSGYVFEKNANGDWEQLQKIVASDRGFFHFFGTAVDISVDYALVGAPFNDVVPLDDDNAGKGYIFHGSCLENLIIPLDSVPSRLFKADSTLVTLDSVHVFPMDSVIFQAGTSITLMPGFWAETGSDFLAHLDACTFLAFQKPPTEFTQNEKRKTPSNNDLTIFPNPNNGSMSIQFNIEEERFTRVDLFHSSGQLIKSIFSGKDIGAYTLEVKEILPAGVYFVRLANADNQKTKKVIVLQN